MYMQNCFKYMILEELLTHGPACGTCHRQGVHSGSARWVHLNCGRCQFIWQYSKQKAVTKHLKGDQESDPPDSSDTRAAKVCTRTH